MLLLVIAVLLFEVIVVLLSLAYILSTKKSFNRSDIKDGFKSAIQELEEEKELEQELISKMRPQELRGVYSSVPEEEPIRSGGELIPANLTDSEKEILRMFYDNEQ